MSLTLPQDLLPVASPSQAQLFNNKKKRQFANCREKKGPRLASQVNPGDFLLRKLFRGSRFDSELIVGTKEVFVIITPKRTPEKLDAGTLWNTLKISGNPLRVIMMGFRKKGCENSIFRRVLEALLDPFSALGGG